MSENSAQKQIIELRAGGPGDPDATRTAAVLAAYFHAEHMRAFRRRLWRYVGAVASVWFLVGVTTEILSKDVLVAGLTALGAVVARAVILEFRAAERLSTILGESRQAQ